MIRPLQFRHGVHPPEDKELTAHLKVRRMPFPDEVPFNPAAVYFRPENLYEG